MDEKELLELAKQNRPNDAPINERQEEIDRFISEVGMIEDPNGCVDLKHIHWRYVKWCQFNKTEPMSNKAIGVYLHRRFRKRKSFRRITYFVNKEPFQLDDREVWVMGAYYREKKSGKKTTDKRKVSRSTETV